MPTSKGRGGNTEGKHDVRLSAHLSGVPFAQGRPRAVSWKAFKGSLGPTSYTKTSCFCKTLIKCVPAVMRTSYNHSAFNRLKAGPMMD